MSMFTSLIIILSILSLCDCNLVMKLERQKHTTRISRGGINFTLQGSIYTSHFGKYITKVKIGSPPQEFTLQIDTGGENTWVNCGCPTSPKSDSFGVRQYCPSNSSSATMITCGDKRCNHHKCKSKQSKCQYIVNYQDLSNTTGFLVSDNIHLDTIMDEHFLTPVLFGCSKDRSGGLAEEDAIDGLIGLNTAALSLVSQFSSPVFSHCLIGGEVGGGLLILNGEIINPNVVYTPLDLSLNKYEVNLQSIAVNGEIVDVDPSVFKSKDGYNPIFDSGSTFVYLGDRAYNPVISALTANVSQYAEPRNVEGYRCFKVSERIDKIFPSVTFNFNGGASMTVNPKDYIFEESWDDTTLRCIGFVKQKGYDPSFTVLGEIILRDKIIVYDIANKRLGWANQNCSKPFNISMRTSVASSPSRNGDYVYTTVSYLSVFLLLCLFM